MTDRRMQVATYGLAGALVGAMVMVPSGVAVADGDDSPAFTSISAQPVAGASTPPALRRAPSPDPAADLDSARRAATSKGTQILQSLTGIQGVGANGVAVAAGPKHVVQATGVRIRALDKATGVRPKGGEKSLLSFFGLTNSVLVTQPAVIYDPVGKRFIATAIANDAGDVGLVMRVSKGTVASPLSGKKWLKPVEFASSDSRIEEPNHTDASESYPMLGVTSDKIIVTAAAVDPDDASVSNRIWFFPKPDYYAGQEPGGWVATLNSTYDGQAPAVNATKQANAFVAIPDTSDVTVTTYTGAATNNPPVFSKNVMYPSNPLTAPPLINQGVGADTLDLGGLAFGGAAWRGNKLYAAATVDSGGDAKVRVFTINTGSGVALSSDKTLGASGQDWFNPDLAADGKGNVLLAANNVGAADGPSLAVFAKKSGSKKWFKARFVAKASDVADNPVGGSLTWRNTTGAALDPTSPWDAWISGAIGESGVTDSLSTKIARVSVAKNKATIKASATKVKKGKKVTFTLKLARPDSKATIKGLPVALQKAPKSGGSWSTIKSGKTAANGTKKFTIKIKKAARYRTLGKAVNQQQGAGRAIDKVTSKAVTITLK